MVDSLKKNCRTFARVDVLNNRCFHIISMAINWQVEDRRSICAQFVYHFCSPAILLLSPIARPVVQCQQIARVRLVLKSFHPNIAIATIADDYVDF